MPWGFSKGFLEGIREMKSRAEARGLCDLLERVVRRHQGPLRQGKPSLQGILPRRQAGLFFKFPTKIRISPAQFLGEGLEVGRAIDRAREAPLGDGDFFQMPSR